MAGLKYCIQHRFDSLVRAKEMMRTDHEDRDQINTGRCLSAPKFEIFHASPSLSTGNRAQAHRVQDTIQAQYTQQRLKRQSVQKEKRGQRSWLKISIGVPFSFPFTFSPLLLFGFSSLLFSLSRYSHTVLTPVFTLFIASAADLDLAFLVLFLFISSTSSVLPFFAFKRGIHSIYAQ